MRLEQLKYLVEVANCKSINKAAQNLYMTQPALSIAINALEEELQYALLKRTKKGVVLTEEGERVLREAQVILDTISDWYQIKGEGEFSLEGVVHILAIPSVCVALSHTLISQLQKNHPKLSIFLHEKTPQYMLSSLENGAVNIGITSCPRGGEEAFCRHIQEGGWQAEKLLEDERCVLMSAVHPFAQKKTLKQAELKQLTLAYYSDMSDDVSEAYKKYFNQDRFFRLSNRESILELVAENGAVGIFPEKTTRSSYLRRNTLIKAVPIADMDMRISYFMLYPKANLMSINELGLVNIIRSQFAVGIESGGQ